MPGYYDLLASEARLTSFLAIAKGDIAPDHCSLGTIDPLRPRLCVGFVVGVDVRIPNPVLGDAHTTNSLIPRQTKLRSPPDSICRRARRALGHLRNRASTPTTFHLQYSNFSVPGLGLKRGLSDSGDHPIATALAAMMRSPRQR